MYEYYSRVRYSEIGPDKLLTLSGIINYFQDCSTFQSEDIGLGIAILEEKQRAWLLNSWQIKVERFPTFGEPILLSTWAYDFKGIYGFRNFLMTDEEKNPLAYANSVWVYIDTYSLTPVRIPADAALPYGHEDKYPMDYAPRKITLPDSFQEMSSFPVVSSNIDTNNHVNNGQYILMGEQFLPNDFIIGQMRAEYRSSAHLGDMINPRISLKDNLCTVVLSGDNNIIYTIIEFTRKDN